MPRNKNNQEPPPTMSWSKATPILVIAGLFDVVRIFFNMFWFFGPALAALYCTSTVSGWVGNLWGLTAAACSAGAAVAGAAVAAQVTIPFGVVMAIAVGLFGWLTIGLILMRTNARIFKTPGNALWLIASLGVAELPLIGTIPSFTLALWRMYRKQIKAEAAALRRWEKENAEARLQEQEQQTAQLMQYQMDTAA